MKPSNWLYAIGRVKPGTQIGPLQAKVSNSLRVWLATIDEYTRNGGSTEIPKQHVVITQAVQESRTCNRRPARDSTC